MAPEYKHTIHDPNTGFCAQIALGQISFVVLHDTDTVRFAGRKVEYAFHQSVIVSAKEAEELIFAPQKVAIIAIIAIMGLEKPLRYSLN